ncbi:MAG: hypothetical protein KDA45_10045, partial [Planctomycetales bacterium]|nr:hypothetical protein [Planctomycetales bacterium]
MKKLWLYSLALNLGLLGLSPAFGQAPNGYNNFGPSSYPVAAPPSTRSVLQSLPQVPQAYNTAAARQQPTGVPSPAPFGAPYQLVAVQDGGVYNPAPQNLVPEANPAP